MIFVLTNVIYIVYDLKTRKSLLVTHYSLVGIQAPDIVVCSYLFPLSKKPVTERNGNEDPQTIFWAGRVAT